MKKVIMGLLMVLSTMTANAQFEAGKTYIGASVSGLGMKYSEQSKFCADLSTTAGCFLANDLLVFGNINYSHRQKFDEFELGVGGRFYIEQNGLYLGVSGAYAHTDANSAKTDNFFVTPELGYAFFLNQYLTIEPAVYYRMSLNEFADGSTVGFRLGFGFYF